MSTDNPFGKKTVVPTIVYQLAILLLGLVLTGVTSYGLLYSNAHNDQRYVRIETYRSDRERDKELKEVVERQINHRFDQQERKLNEIASDVKMLLRKTNE